MLKKKYRGLQESEVSKLFSRKGVETLSNKSFRINWFTENQDFPQFVVITSGKLHKSAVVRNSLRRRLYELIRLNFSDWTLGLRVAILVKKSALELTSNEFKESFLELFSEVNKEIKKQGNNM